MRALWAETGLGLRKVRQSALDPTAPHFLTSLGGTGWPCSGSCGLTWDPGGGPGARQGARRWAAFSVPPAAQHSSPSQSEQGSKALPAGGATIVTLPKASNLWLRAFLRSCKACGSQWEPLWPALIARTPPVWEQWAFPNCHASPLPPANATLTLRGPGRVYREDLG